MNLSLYSQEMFVNVNLVNFFLTSETNQFNVAPSSHFRSNKKLAENDLRSV